MQQQQSFKDFWVFYKACHSNRHNQWLHFAGATLFIGITITALCYRAWWLFPVGIFIGYWLPHIGHTRHQHNQSLRGSHPVYCVLGAALLYLGMWRQLLRR